MQTDIVCQKKVEEEKPRYFSEYDACTYFFCSPECKRKFDDHPDYFIHERAKERLGIA